MVEYSDRLQQAMNEAGMEVGELADRLGVSYQAVKKVLEGKSNAFNAINHAIAARILGVDSDWLALGTGEMRPQREWPFVLIDEAKLRALSDSQKRDIETLVLSATHFRKIDITPTKPQDIDTGS